MALGRQGGREQAMWVATSSLPRSAGHPFYTRLNAVLKEADFDRFAEEQCEPYYAAGQGRPSIPPGTYFRMLMVGYFEGIDSQRGIAWRCSDSLALREFLGLGLEDRTPDHSSLTIIRQRLPLEVHEEVFARILKILVEKGLVRGKTLAVDATTLEANAAMKSIVRRETGESWSQYIGRLAVEEGIENPTEEDARRLDRRRRRKRVSNKDWESKSDPASRITKMKDGRTHLAYKAEHVIDLESEVIVSAKIYSGDQADGTTIFESLSQSQENIVRADAAAFAEEVVADKGYHKAAALAECAEWGIRTYIPERRDRAKRRWTDKPGEWKQAFRANRRRVRGRRSRALQRLRSERVERSFAHVCRSGKQRRTWLRGLEDVQKRYLLTAAGRNLGLLMRHLFGIGTPRTLQGASAALVAIFSVLLQPLRTIVRSIPMRWTRLVAYLGGLSPLTHSLPLPVEIGASSTDC